MDENELPVTFIVMESSRCWIAASLDVDVATTVIALISEDPANWDEALSVWPRYRTPVVCEFSSSLPFEETDQADAVGVLAASDSWVAIDFRNQRVLTGGQFAPVGRNASFAMDVDDTGKQRFPLSIHLPPWWELHESVSARMINQARQAPNQKPHVDRDVLYGDAFLASIAAGILKAFESSDFRESHAETDAQARYRFTVAVHRDWLMTPREDLGGRMPRELLHGAHEWISKVTWSRRLRFENNSRFEDGQSMVALPNDWMDFAVAPMGSEEMCVYFDLCRELIEAGWSWCATEKEAMPQEAAETVLSWLIQFLREAKDNWMEQPFEGGSPPSFIIECDRRRVPRGSGVPIDGIDGVEAEQHMADCDCPICQMMADGVFGVGFTSLDGYHLETDNEFAFSMIESRDAWEQQQRDDAFLLEELDRRREERDADDPFASAWSGIRDEEEGDARDGPFAGERGGLIKMAFMVAGVIGGLEKSDAPHDEIQSINESFAKYRRCDAGQRAEHASNLKAVLQSLSDRYPNLVSKSADLQSRIDEAARFPAMDDNDSPF